MPDIEKLWDFFPKPQEDRTLPEKSWDSSLSVPCSGTSCRDTDKLGVHGTRLERSRPYVQFPPCPAQILSLLTHKKETSRLSAGPMVGLAVPHAGLTPWCYPNMTQQVALPIFGR